ncbi:MAG: YnfA family protein [Nanoarchaeota archaeon]|nr:YnfA family protein [Nanoarchaeota archaeon]
MVNIIIISLILFFVAALFEIGGGYMIWRWLKYKKDLFIGLFGGLALFSYGVIQTLQQANFGRTYAAYGGIFIFSSIIWGAIVDKKTPDRYEIIGALITLVGALIIFFAPR